MRGILKLSFFYPQYVGCSHRDPLSSQPEAGREGCGGNLQRRGRSFSNHDRASLTENQVETIVNEFVSCDTIHYIACVN